MAVDIADFTTALRQYASGVCLLTVRDDLDDVGTTVTSVMSVSAEPPLVAVGLTDGGYPVEVLHRGHLPPWRGPYQGTARMTR